MRIHVYLWPQQPTSVLLTSWCPKGHASSLIRRQGMGRWVRLECMIRNSQRINTKLKKKKTKTTKQNKRQVGKGHLCLCGSVNSSDYTSVWLKSPGQVPESSQAFSLLGIEPRALWVLGKHYNHRATNTDQTHNRHHNCPTTLAKYAPVWEPIKRRRYGAQRHLDWTEVPIERVPSRQMSPWAPLSEHFLWTYLEINEPLTLSCNPHNQPYS